MAARETELLTELDAVQGAHAELEHQRDTLDRFARGAEPSSTKRPRLRALPDAEPPAVDGVTLLRGAHIREAAVRVLATSPRPSAPVHYRDWFELLIAQGFMPAGKDALATFLTQIGRSPVVRRTTTSGTYLLDLEFPARAREGLTTLRTQLAQLQGSAPGDTIDEIATNRERKAHLTALAQETERQLHEALRALGQEAEGVQGC